MSSVPHPSFRKCTYNRARLHRYSRNVNQAINYILQCVPALNIWCTHLWSSRFILFVIKDRRQRSWALSAFTFGVLDRHRHIDGDPMQLIFDIFLQRDDRTLHHAHNALRSRELSFAEGVATCIWSSRSTHCCFPLLFMLMIPLNSEPPVSLKVPLGMRPFSFLSASAARV